MISSRVIDTHRLSIVARALEKEMARFYQDLLSVSGNGREADPAPIHRAMEKAGFEEIVAGTGGDVAGRIGSGRALIRMEAGAGLPGAGGIAPLVYAGKLVHELGLYGDFTWWVSTRHSAGAHADCVLRAEPTGLCIHRGMRGRVEISESHLLVRSAIATYEALFELPPVVHGGGPAASSPVIAFGPGDRATLHGPAPTDQLLKAAEFYAAFPATFAELAARH